MKAKGNIYPSLADVRVRARARQCAAARYPILVSQPEMMEIMKRANERSVSEAEYAEEEDGN